MLLQVQKPQNILLAMSVDYLELNVRPANRLIFAGIDTIDQLCQLTENDIQKIYGMVDKSVAETTNDLAKLVLILRKLLVRTVLRELSLKNIPNFQLSGISLRSIRELFF